MLTLVSVCPSVHPSVYLCLLSLFVFHVLCVKEKTFQQLLLNSCCINFLKFYPYITF